MVFLLSEEHTQIPGCIPGRMSSVDPIWQCSTLTHVVLISFPALSQIQSCHPPQSSKGLKLQSLWGHNDPKAFIWLKTIPCPGRAAGARSLQNGDSPHCTRYWLTSSFAVCLCGIFSARIYGKLMKDIFSCKPYFLNFLVLARINAQRGKQGQIESTRRC